MKYIHSAIAAVAALFLASCGTTSSLQDTQGNAITSARKFHKVVVQNFISTVTGDEADAAKSAASGMFPEHIVKQLIDDDDHHFSSVTRNGKIDADTLVIDGVVTRFVEGNAALRLFIGMGAGSSYFDATTRFKDSTGKVLGEIVTDKNSWGLGGGLAAGQTVFKFMENASETVAEEARKIAAK